MLVNKTMWSANVLNTKHWKIIYLSFWSTEDSQDYHIPKAYKGIVLVSLYSFDKE